MNLQEREEKQREIFERMITLSNAKGHDYGEIEDSLYNLRMFGVYGIVVRLHDKMCRLKSLMQNGSYAVKGETIEDTFIDIANYCMLALILAEEESLPDTP